MPSPVNLRPVKVPTYLGANLHFVFRILPITYCSLRSPAYALDTSLISISISSGDRVNLAAFLIVRQKFRLLPVVNLHPGVVLHSTIFLPLQPTFLVVALTNGANLTGAKTGEGKEEEEEEEEDGEEERDFRKEKGEDNDFREDAEEDLGFTEDPDNERMGLLGVESYEDEGLRGDLGG
jgi:hypothetical protein